MTSTRARSISSVLLVLLNIFWYLVATAATLLYMPRMTTRMFEHPSLFLFPFLALLAILLGLRAEPPFELFAAIAPRHRGLMDAIGGVRRTSEPHVEVIIEAVPGPNLP